MKKMNKKGFTLIEMLVVIAIIAVLVAIIIPTVTSATDKAVAAANAANLRSIKAELTTAMLTGEITLADGENANEDDIKPYWEDVTLKPLFTAATTDDVVSIVYEADDKSITITYEGKKIEEWAAEAN